MNVFEKSKLGYLFVIAGVCLYSFSDAIMKYFMGVYSVHQVTFLRTFFRFIPFLIVACYQRANPLKTSRVQENVLRALLASVGTYAFMCAYRHSAMTDVYVVGLTTAIFVIPLSVWILGEKFHFQNMIAILLGFSGICLACRPGCGLLQVGVLFAAGGAIISALNQVLIKRLSSTERELTIIFYHHIVLGMLSFALGGWGFSSMKLSHLAVMFVGGMIGALAQYCMIHAFKLSSSSKLASAGYFMLIPNTIFDFLLYNKTPDIYIIGGLILISIGSIRAFSLKIQ